jgi:hypothetical protein
MVMNDNQNREPAIILRQHNPALRLNLCTFSTVILICAQRAYIHIHNALLTKVVASVYLAQISKQVALKVICKLTSRINCYFKLT